MDDSQTGRHRRQAAPEIPQPLSARAWGTIAAAIMSGLLLSGSLVAVDTTWRQPTLTPIDPADYPAAAPQAGDVLVLVPAPLSAKAAEQTSSPEPEPVPTTAGIHLGVHALANEGIIAVVQRVCGRSANWVAVAVANAIGPPDWPVRLDATLTVDCEAAPLPVPAPAALPDAPATSAEAVAQAAPVSAGWVQPLAGACIISGFGMRWGRMHEGIDLPAGSGTPIAAVGAGTVSVQWDGGGGNMTMIDHGGGLWTVYMHQSGYEVTSGWVEAGQTIGYVGSTGDSQGPHLHLEVHTGGVWSGKVDPAQWLADRGIGYGWC